MLRPEIAKEAKLEDVRIVTSCSHELAALDDPKSVDVHRQRLAQLHKDYNDRHNYWLGQNFNAALRDKLTQDSNAEAVKFWETTEREFLPALSKGDLNAARAAYAKMTAAYTAHRAVIDAVVADATKFGDNTIAEAASLTSSTWRYCGPREASSSSSSC